VVNATSLGLNPDSSGRVPDDPDTFDQGMLVADVIHNPPRIPLIADARARGCTMRDGLGTLVNQGVITLELWSGRARRPEIMGLDLATVFPSLRN
jgi:shikimate dehydrogenase